MRAQNSVRAKVSTMQYCDTSFVQVVSANLLGTLTAFGLNGAVLAAGTCIEAPNLNAGQGRHWYYRADRINHRKCWYVAETELKIHENAPEATPSPTSPPNSRVPPAAPRETPKVVHSVAKERSRPTPRPEPKSAATEERNQQSPSRSSAEHAEQVNSQPLDQAAQDALLLEFLRWRELQKNVK
jgi:outer membrane biosynthesis protein TonB